MTTSMLGQQGQCKFEEKWPLIRPTVLKLLRQESVPRPEWTDLFWNVHSVCMWDEKEGPTHIYNSLERDILDFIKQAQSRVLQHREESALLRAYIAEWGKFFTQCNYLPEPFTQLEANLQGKLHSCMPKKSQQADESLVRKLMLDSWNYSIFSDIKDKLQYSAMKLVHAERHGEAFDTQLVIGVRESYVNLCSDTGYKLKIYCDHFEKAYLEAAENFYKQNAPAYLEQNGVQNYMRYGENKLKEEEARAKRYLETGYGCKSVEYLIDTCVRVLVTNFKETILAECATMIKNNETDTNRPMISFSELRLMFNLMNRVPDGQGIEPMLEDLEKHIVDKGLADMMSAAKTITTDSEKYVDQLLDLFTSFSLLVTHAFNDDHRFLTARDKAYKTVVNDISVFTIEIPVKNKGVGAKSQPESKCPELLANFCDMMLRKTTVSKRLTPEEVDKKLKNVLLVLKYVQNKDVFMRYHKAHLTRRLILDSSADSEKEENMVEWLRDVGVPADFVNKLQRMFQDIKVSEDLNHEFKEAHRNNNEGIADAINIKILNAGAWARSSERIPVTLPVELEDYIPQVEEFYKHKHSGRKLQWHHAMSNGVITFSNDMGRYELEVTTFQMGVLFAWNQRPKEKLSYESLKLATELPDQELRKTILSLMGTKNKILMCSTEIKNLRDFSDATEFWINQQYAFTKSGKVQKRGKTNLIGRLQLTTEKGREEENEGIMHLRILRVQEAIVKIMKMRKRLTNAALQTELVEILKNMFLPSKKLIKEQIEWLIEHKYMKRDEDDINTFIYMA